MRKTHDVGAFARVGPADGAVVPAHVRAHVRHNANFDGRARGVLSRRDLPHRRSSHPAVGPPPRCKAKHTAPLIREDCVRDLGVQRVRCLPMLCGECIDLVGVCACVCGRG